MRKLYKKFTKTIIVFAIVCFSFVNVTAAEQTVIKDIDLSSEYATEAILALADMNIIQGDQNGNFQPQKAVTRAEMITMIVKALNVDRTALPEEPTFKDVPAGHWAFEYVEAAYRAGIVNGISADTFGADIQCTREQMAAMFVRSLRLSEIDGAYNFALENINILTDKANVSDWAKKEVELAIKTKLMYGVSENTFEPKGIASKEQVAVVTNRFIKSKENILEEIIAGTNKVKYSELYSALEKNSNMTSYKGELDLVMELFMTGKQSGDSLSILTNSKNRINGENYHSQTNMYMKLPGLEPIGEDIEQIHLDGKFYSKNPETGAWEEQNEDGIIDNTTNQYEITDQNFLVNFNNYLIENKGEVTLDSITATKYVVELDNEAFKSLLPEGSIENLEIPLDEAINDDARFTAEFYVNDKEEMVQGVVVFTGSFDGGEEMVDMNLWISIGLKNIGQEYEITIPEQL